MEKKKYSMHDFAAEYGLKVEGHTCFGVFCGYRVHVKYRAMGNPSCLLTVVTDTKGRDQILEKYLEKNKKQLKLTNYGVVGIGCMVSPQLYVNIFPQIRDILKKITAYLKKEGFPGAEICPYCGLELGEDKVEMSESGIPFQAHERCFERALSVAKQKEADELAVPDKKLAGFGGACLGALVSCAVFVLLYLWWNFAAISAAVGVLLGGYFYGKLGGKKSWTYVISCALTTLILTLAVFALCVLLQAGTGGSVSGGLLDKIAENLREGSAYRLQFLLNLIFIFVFTLLGSLYNLFLFMRSRKKFSFNITRLQ